MDLESQRRRTDLSADQLDDELDRDELRERYYGLLQELRVLLPGVQILVAFLLVAPFSNRFPELDATGRDLYGVALASGVLAVIAFSAPTVFHRVGPRRSRSERLQWGIRLTRLGLVFLAVSLTSAIVVVFRLVFGEATAVIAGLAIAAALVGMWLVLPLEARSSRHR